MGKKKSVVLMWLLTIVIAVLCFITAFPTCTVPFTDGIKKWNPTVMQYDLGMDLGGGYYAYYYPEGVIPESEFRNNRNMTQGDEREEYTNSYVEMDGVYVSKDPEDGIMSEDGETLNPEFVEAFNAAAKEIGARFAAKGYDDYRVSVISGCALRVELPMSEASKNQTAKESATQALAVFALTGEMTLKQGGEIVPELKDDDASVKDLIKSIKVKSKYEVVYLQVDFTEKGKEVLENFKTEAEAAASDQSQSQSGSTQTTLDIVVGEESLLSFTTEHIDGDKIKYNIAQDSEKRYVETLAILLNSAMENGGFDVQFRELTGSEIREFAPAYNENVLMFLYAGLAVIILALLVFAIVRMGRYGVVNAYASLSYIVIVALCYAFITKGVFAITLGSVLMFLIGLVLVNVLHHNIYSAIKAEFTLGKTVESSVKSGYKKTLWGTIDIYVVLLFGALALLIGGAGLHTMAIQALICVLAAAFCNLLWGRAINFTFLSASKNKYKYFRFVREDDDDDE